MRRAPQAAQRRRDGALFADGKHDYGKLVFSGESKRRRIHDCKIFGYGLVMGQDLITPRRRVFFGIGGVNAVDLRRLEHCVGGKFRRRVTRRPCRW